LLPSGILIRLGTDEKRKKKGSINDQMPWLSSVNSS